MSPAKVAWGWGASMASVAPRSGKLLVTTAGTVTFMWDASAGYPNWGYTQATVTANEATCGAAIRWLTGKTSGMNILRLVPSGSIAGAPWGSHARDFITRDPGASGSQMYGDYGPWNYGGGLGATLTSGTPSSIYGWTNTDWGGWNPFDYDLVLLQHGYRFFPAPDNRPVLDYYLQNRGAIWGYQMYFDTKRWAAYGQGYDGVYTAPDGNVANSYMILPISVAPWGGSYQYGIYTSVKLALDTNTMGGDATLYGNGFFLWSL